MEKIVVDIALLLPENINKICTLINQEKNADAFCNLSKENNYPHITLIMGVLETKNIEKINTILEEISIDFSKLELEIIKLSHSITPENKISCSFNISTTKEIKALQKKITEKCSPFFYYEIKENMFFLDSDESFNPVSNIWIKGFENQKLKIKKFHPHISLKCRKAEYTNLPIKFISSQIALCHLGNYCSCRTILGLQNLK